jgi:hypothetical protein
MGGSNNAKRPPVVVRRATGGSTPPTTRQALLSVAGVLPPVSCSVKPVVYQVTPAGRAAMFSWGLRITTDWMSPLLGVREEAVAHLRPREGAGVLPPSLCEGVGAEGCQRLASGRERRHGDEKGAPPLTRPSSGNHLKPKARVTIASRTEGMGGRQHRPCRASEACVSPRGPSGNRGTPPPLTLCTPSAGQG